MSESDASSQEQENDQDQEQINDDYFVKLENMCDIMQNVANSLNSQKEDLEGKIVTFDEYTALLKTEEEFHLALKDPLSWMIYALESAFTWFNNPDNWLPLIYLDADQPQIDAKYDWSEHGDIEVEVIQKIPLRDDKSIEGRRLNRMKTIVNSTSIAIQLMEIYGDKLRRNQEGLEWCIEQNSKYAFKIDKKNKKLVVRILNTLKAQHEFLAKIHPALITQFRNSQAAKNIEELVESQKKEAGGSGDVAGAQRPLSQEAGSSSVTRVEADINPPPSKRRKISKITEIITDEMGRYILDPAEIGRLTNCMQARFLHLVHFLKETTDWKVREEGMSRVLVACNDYTATEEDIKDSSWMNFMSERKLVAERMDGYKHIIALYGALENLKESSHASDVQKVVLFIKSQVDEGIDMKEPVDAEAGYSIDLSIWFRSKLLKKIQVYWKENRDPMPYKYTGNLDTLPFVKSRIKLYEEKASTDVKSAAMFLMYELMGESDQLESLLAFYKDLESDLATAETKEQEFFESVYGIDLKTLVVPSTC